MIVSTYGEKGYMFDVLSEPVVRNVAIPEQEIAFCKLSSGWMRRLITIFLQRKSYYTRKGPKIVHCLFERQH